MKPGAFAYTLAASFLIAGGVAPAFVGESGQQPMRSVTDLRESAVLAMKLDGKEDHVSMVLPDGTHKAIGVSLEKTTYEGTLINETDVPRTTRPGVWFCYELEPNDKDASYSWYIWLDNPSAGRFKLFTTRDDETYLAWVDMWSLCFAEVSKPMDKSAKTNALRDQLNRVAKPGIERAYAGDIIGQDQFIDAFTTGHYASIYLTSLEKDGATGFRLQFHGKDPSKVYTLVTDKEVKYGWRLVK